MFEHEHPLNLIDLWLEQLQLEENYEEDENEPIAKQDFRCSCSRCEEEINWQHRYYYTCSQCGYFIHKFCAQLPERMKDVCHAHPLVFLQRHIEWLCNICRSSHSPQDLRYRCSQCDFDIDVKCATKRLQKNVIYLPIHAHPLVRMSRQILCVCDACGEKHEGIFYHCPLCPDPFIHNHCAFLPTKLQIQKFTDDSFSHIHPLDLCYSFPKADQESKFYPLCRLCRRPFKFDHLWIYKCEKCRYYTHLNCATSRNEPFMSILTSPGTGKTIKNYKDIEYPDLVHLPFPDPSYSILRHLFFKENGSRVLEINTGANTHISHQHPLMLEDARCCSSVITSPSPAYSRTKSISYHDPMKKIELLCDACIRPIMSGPIYVCANEEEHCNFVLHEWCSQLPAELKDHPDHPQHTLVLHSKIDSFYGVFGCDMCFLPCTGFVYCCKECDYCIDVHCAFIPKEITHASHPNHLLSRTYTTRDYDYSCSICGSGNVSFQECLFVCHSCDFQIHSRCALLIPKTTTIKLDKHPMKLSYFPIENHESEYFCEVCEEELNPEKSFYHCHECMQSMHIGCAPSILRYDMQIRDSDRFRGVYLYVNMKFGRTYIPETHPHPLSLVRGLESDGKCTVCRDSLKDYIILKCINCELAIHYWCQMKLST